MELVKEHSVQNTTSYGVPAYCEHSNSSYQSAWNSSCAVEYANGNGKVYWALMMIPLPLVAVIGNILVILSVYKEKTLQNATNYFIVSLAFADLLVAAVVMPFAVYVLVNGDWELSETVCDFYIALDVTCSTASIFNLVAISIDRFIAVTQPIKYSKHKNNKRVFVTIVFVWVVSAAIGSPIVLGLNTSPERIPNLCVFYNSDFIIYSSLSSFYIPCLVMVYLYYKIFKAIHERVKKAIGGQKVTTKVKTNKQGLIVENVSHSADEQYTSSGTKLNILKYVRRKRLPAVQEVEESNPGNTRHRSADTEDTNVIAALQQPRRWRKLRILKIKWHRSKDPDASLTSELVGVTDSPQSSGHRTADTDGIEGTSTVPDKINGQTAGTVETDNELQNVTMEVEELTGNPGDIPDAVKEGGRRLKFRFIKYRKNRSSRKKREKNAARRERKATKTLAIVLGVFLICWVPFFTCNILDAICIKLQTNECRPGVTAFLLTTWLGYINSCVNPVIYTIFNMEFRKAFKKIVFMSDPSK